MTDTLYPPDRARQLRILLWTAVAAAAVMTIVAAVLLLGGAPAVRVIVVLLVPALMILALGALTLRLLGNQDPRARIAAISTGVVAVLVGLLLSRTGSGLLVAVIGILVLLFAALPGRGD